MNKFIFWIIGFALLGFGGLLLNGSFGPKSYTTILIVTVVMLIITKVLSFSDIFLLNNKKNNFKPSFSWNTQNIFYTIVALLFMVGMVFYGLKQAEIEKKERKIKFQKMDIDELGNYITTINSSNGIGIATYIEKSIYKENRIQFYYVVSKGIISDSLVLMGDAIERTKEEIIEDIRQEDCTKTAFHTFLEKGGVIEYIYHKKKNDKKRFMFDANITYNMCIK